ncbi:MAG: formate/nitrite transporter FocA (FNT family) [Arenicella sp.]|jgi:formate/nitrite transporter FocA (FNT family)
MWIKRKPKEKTLQVEDISNSPKSKEQIMREQIEEGEEMYGTSGRSVFISSLSAGLEVGFSFFLIAILHTHFAGEMDSKSIFFMTAFAYPIGFILVVLGKSILFTEQTSLLTLPVLNRKRSLGELLKIWGIVLLGNLLGGYIITFLVLWIGTAMNMIELESVREIAHHVSSPKPFVIFGSAVLAGWLMGLLSWLVTSSQETISRILIIYLITTLIGIGGLHHSIVGSIEVFAGLISDSDTTFLDYLSFQVVATLGNAMGGGVFVALLKYRAFASNF